MTAPSGARGAATAAELNKLHRLVVRSLIQRIESAPSAELLQVARSVLRDNGLAGRAADDKDVEQLRTLYDLLVQRLIAALSESRPSAAVLSEARQMLAQNGITKDIDAAVDQATAMQALADLDFPFPNH